MNLLQIRAFSRDLAPSDKLNFLNSLHSGIFYAKTNETGVKEFVTNWYSTFQGRQTRQNSGGGGGRVADVVKIDATIWVHF